MIRYAFAPLAEAMRLSEDQACRALNVSGSTAKEYRTLGMSERVADRLATRAGFHPNVIWPEWGQEALERALEADEARMVVCADERCGERFLPHRWGQKFCSETCQRRTASRRSERRRYHADPEWAAAKRAATREYQRENRRAVNATARQWRRKKEGAA